jgi:hypothetical protein
MRLIDVILARENYLSKSLSKLAVISQNEQASVRADEPLFVSDIKIQKSGKRRFIIPLLVLILSGLILIGGLKIWEIYDLAILVRQDAVYVQTLATGSTSRLERVKTIGPALVTLRRDFKKLKNETKSFFWMSPLLEWIPVYGGDLASVQDLAIIADSLLTSAELSYQAILPLVEEDGLTSLNPSNLTEVLYQAQPQFMSAQQALDQAVTARSRLNLNGLSPQVRDRIINDVDPLMSLMQDGLAVAVEFPRLMGATDEGPKTYLLLVQNEDELRPTGGFITAAGTLLVQDGHLISLNFLNSGDFDNWERPYPVAPWQLREYMNSPVLIFRDANWFTNYPTAAL